MSDDKFSEIKSRAEWGFEDEDKAWLVAEVERLRGEAIASRAAIEASKGVPYDVALAHQRIRGGES